MDQGKAAILVAIWGWHTLPKTVPSVSAINQPAILPTARLDQCGFSAYLPHYSSLLPGLTCQHAWCG